MKKIVIYIFIAMFALYPGSARADNEFLAKIQDKLESAMSKGNELLHKYTAIQANLQELTTSRGVLKALRETAERELKMKLVAELKNVKVSDLSLKGVAEQIKSGPNANLELTKIIGIKYTGRVMQSDDVKKKVSHDTEIQVLQANNLAAMYARAIVRRLQLKEEYEALENENADISGQEGDGSMRSDVNEESANTEGNSQEASDAQLAPIIDAYKRSMNEANRRWNSLVQAKASQVNLNASAVLAGISLTEEQAQDEAQETEGTEDAEDLTSDSPTNDNDEAAGQSLYDIGSELIDGYNSSGIGGGVSSAINLVNQQTGGGNIMPTNGNNIYNTGKGVVDGVSSGDYGRALENLATGFKNMNNNGGGVLPTMNSGTFVDGSHNANAGSGTVK